MAVPDYFFWIAFAAFAAYALYRFIKHGGFRGMLYGSAIARTVGEVELEPRKGMTTTFRMHVLS